jgi:hypothetical protein
MDAQSESISRMLFACIDLYTTANLDNMEKVDMKVLISACRDQVIKHFKMLGVIEIKDAFEMFANDSLNIKVDFYGGKFKVPHLSKILNAYLVYRKKYIATYENQSNLLDWRKPKPEEVIKQKNLEAAETIKHDYTALVTHFEENGNLQYLEKNIGLNWGKVLVNEGIIVFSIEEKKEIVEECKIYVNKQIENILLAGEVNAIAKKGLKDMRMAFKNKEHNSNFKGRWVARYDKLIVIKSILKA